MARFDYVHEECVTGSLGVWEIRGPIQRTRIFDYEEQPARERERWTTKVVMPRISCSREYTKLLLREGFGTLYANDGTSQSSESSPISQRAVLLWKIIFILISVNLIPMGISSGLYGDSLWEFVISSPLTQSNFPSRKLARKSLNSLGKSLDQAISMATLIKH